MCGSVRIILCGKVNGKLLLVVVTALSNFAPLMLKFKLVNLFNHFFFVSEEFCDQSDKDKQSGKYLK